MAKYPNKIRNIGKKIQSLRKGQGFSQEKFANAIGKTTAYVSKIERAECIPSLETLITISEHLQVPPGELLNSLKHEDDSPRKKIRSRINQLLSITSIKKANLILKVAQQIHQSD